MQPAPRRVKCWTCEQAAVGRHRNRLCLGLVLAGGTFDTIRQVCMQMILPFNVASRPLQAGVGASR